MPYSFQSLVIGHKTSTASIFKGKVHKVSWITANKLQRLLKNSKCCHEAPFLDSVQGLSKGKVSRDRLEREVPLQKTFVILSGVHILVVCYLKKLHDKSDIINAGVAGCITRLALRISGSPLAEEQPLHIEYRETVVPRGYFLECESQERGRISCIYPYKQAIGQALRQGFAEVRYEILWALKKSFTEDCQVVLIDGVQKRMARNLRQMPLRYGFLSTSPTQMQ